MPPVPKIRYVLHAAELIARAARTMLFAIGVYPDHPAAGSPHDATGRDRAIAGVVRRLFLPAPPLFPATFPAEVRLL